MSGMLSWDFMLFFMHVSGEGADLLCHKAWQCIRNYLQFFPGTVRESNGGRGGFKDLTWSVEPRERIYEHREQLLNGCAWLCSSEKVIYHCMGVEWYYKTSSEQTHQKPELALICTTFVRGRERHTDRWLGARSGDTLSVL